MQPEVVAVAYRGEWEESRHFGSIAVVDAQGELLYSRGDPERLTFLRSAAKPFQVLPLLETGAAAAFGFTLDEVAVMCGSHSGEDQHVERVLSILQKVGLTETDLKCGTQVPFHKPTAQRLVHAGEKPGPARNACSGKHAAMLALCRHQGWPLEGYLELEHPVQQLMLHTVADLTGYPAEQIRTGRDTCGVPVFAVPLKHMAWGYARLARAEHFRGERRQAIATIQRAMAQCPELVAGTGRFTTALLQTTGGRLVAKDGAEACFGIGVIPRGIGLAVKIEDGSDRALAPVVLEALLELNLIDADARQALRPFHRRVIKTWSGVTAGHLSPVRLFPTK
ncbi:MAG TPA: asparaginase [Firmicutes bacterium]|nr:asparaginase [Bacillota bacterium]